MGIIMAKIIPKNATVLKTDNWCTLSYTVYVVSTIDLLFSKSQVIKASLGS